MSRANGDYDLGEDLSLPQLLYAIKKKLRGGVVDESFTAGLNLAEADALVRDATEGASSVRSFQNTLVPINRIPPEILSLIPHNWKRRGCRYPREVDRDLISMTHVCRRWRQILVSHYSSLWTHLDLRDPDKTRAFVERSRSLPLNVTLIETGEFAYRRDSFLEVVPHLNRLGSLTVKASSQTLSELSSYFPSPAPILKELKMTVYEDKRHDTVPDDFFIPDTIFPEHPPLHKLILSGVTTDLPWRNLSNLTEFELHHPTETVDPLFTTQVLDFLASAPLLRRIVIRVDTSISFDLPPRRMISLPNLKKLVIDDMQPNSTFLNHLSIPTGASLDVTLWIPPEADSENSVCFRQMNDDLQHIATVDLNVWESTCRWMRLDGPNGELRVRRGRGSWGTRLFFPLLGKFDLSKTQKLSVTFPRPPNGELIEDCAVFKILRTCNLRTHILNRCENLPFIHALNPRRNQPVLCPKLEELFIDVGICKNCPLEDLMEMASERAKSSFRLSTIKINRGEGDFSLLREYVPHVELKWNTWDVIPDRYS